MKNKILFFAAMLIASKYVYAGESNVLYYKHRINYGGVQITKNFYNKKSVKKINVNSQKLYEVSTNSTVTSPEGTVKYRSTLQINCSNKTFKTVRHWSSGFGEDRGIIVDGKWHGIAEFDDTPFLAKKICAEK